MKRRNALRSMSLSFGGSVVLPIAILQSCQRDDYQAKFLTLDQIELLDEIGETILPETEDSHGAKFINIGKFMDHFIADCYSSEDQDLITAGLLTFESSCSKKYNTGFVNISAESKFDYLVLINAEASKSNEPHYFLKLKELILLGYFTSEEGATKALQYLPVPGKFEGDIKINTDHKAWALG